MKKAGVFKTRQKTPSVWRIAWIEPHVTWQSEVTPNRNRPIAALKSSIGQSCSCSIVPVYEQKPEAATEMCKD